MTVTAAELKIGMTVVGSDGFDVGKVKEVRERDVLIDMKFHKDTYAPLEAIEQVQADRAVLTMPAAQAYRENWPTA